MSRSVTPSAYNRRQSPLGRRRVLHASASANLSACFAEAATAPTGFAELSKVVVAQQRQMDGLIDKVAALMSAMHTEVLDDVRRSRRPQSATLGALPCATRERGGDLCTRKQDLLMGARENFEGKLHNNDLSHELCDMQGQLRHAHVNFEVKLRDAQHCLRSEIRDTQGRFTADVNSLRTRLSHLEDLVDRDEVAEFRRSVEARLDSHAADVQSRQGALANELSQKLEAQLQEIREARPDGSHCREQLAEEVMACVEARLQSQMADDGGALGLFREQLRKEAESRMDSKMTQGFGLTQRLMTELRHELQGQLLQVHEGTKRLAVEFSRSLEAHELQVARAVQHTLSKGCAKGDGDASAEEFSSTRVDSMEDRFGELSQQLIEEVQRHLDAQQVDTQKLLQLIVRDELQHKVSAEPIVDAAAVAATTKQLAACQAASAECKRCVNDASRELVAAAAAMEQRLEEHLAVCRTAADDCQHCLHEIQLRTDPLQPLQ